MTPFTLEASSSRLFMAFSRHRESYHDTEVDLLKTHGIVLILAGLTCRIRISLRLSFVSDFSSKVLAGTSQLLDKATAIELGPYRQLAFHDDNGNSLSSNRERRRRVVGSEWNAWEPWWELRAPKET